MSGARVSARRDLDSYETAHWQVDALVDHLPELREAASIWCPCAGDGSIVRRFQQRGIGASFVTNDIDEAQGADFSLDATKPETWATMAGESLGYPDWVVENPPFNAEIDILRHAYEAARIGVVFMSRVSFAEPTDATQHQGKPCSPRGPWLSAHPYAKRITLERYSFTGNGKSDSATTDWLVWAKPGIVIAPPFGVSAYGYRNRSEPTP